MRAQNRHSNSQCFSIFGLYDLSLTTFATFLATSTTQSPTLSPTLSMTFLATDMETIELREKKNILFVEIRNKILNEDGSGSILLGPLGRVLI